MVFFDSSVSAHCYLLRGWRCECTGGAARSTCTQGAGISCPGAGRDGGTNPAGAVRKAPALQAAINKKNPFRKGEPLAF